MKTVGIDIGTTTISALVLETEGNVSVETETIPNGTFLPAERPWERRQDALAVVDKAKNLLDELLDTNPDIAAIGLTGQMHGILYLDRSGRCISPLYTWQDGGGDQPYGGEPSLTAWIRRTCGVEAATGYGLVTHVGHCKTGATPAGAETICTIADYFGMVLTKRKSPLLHISNAASLGFFDAQRNVFQREALLAAGVDERILPEFTSNFSILGTYRGRPVTAAIGDNQASFLGSVGLEEDALLVNMGTGGQISALSTRYFTAPGIEARPLAPGHWLLVGSSLCGGRAYAILERFFRDYVRASTGIDAPQYEIMEQLARAAAGREDPMRVSTQFHGSRVDPGLRGSIRNLSEDNFTPEGLIRGVLEGMADELYERYLQIQAGIGIRASRLVGSGNGLRKNPVLRRIFKEKFQARLSLAPVEEEAACGAAFVSAASSHSASK